MMFCEAHNVASHTANMTVAFKQITVSSKTVVHMMMIRFVSYYPNMINKTNLVSMNQ